MHCSRSNSRCTGRGGESGDMAKPRMTEEWRRPGWLLTEQWLYTVHLRHRPNHGSRSLSRFPEWIGVLVWQVHLFTEGDSTVAMALIPERENAGKRAGGLDFEPTVGHDCGLGRNADSLSCPTSRKVRPGCSCRSDPVPGFLNRRHRQNRYLRKRDRSMHSRRELGDPRGFDPRR